MKLSFGAIAAILVVLLAIAFFVGRRIESGRNGQWQGAARQLQASFQPAPPGILARFGPQAPWTAWSRDGELQCTRAIDGSSAEPPFALLQVRYSVRERRGEEHPDSWYEVTVAVVGITGGQPAGKLRPVGSPDAYLAVHDGQWLFVWKKGSIGAGESLDASELPALLQQARALATPLSRAVAMR